MSDHGLDEDLRQGKRGAGWRNPIVVLATIATAPPFLFFGWPFLMSLFYPDIGIDNYLLDMWTIWAAVGFCAGMIAAIFFIGARKFLLATTFAFFGVVDGFYAIIEYIVSTLRIC